MENSEDSKDTGTEIPQAVLEQKTAVLVTSSCETRQSISKNEEKDILDLDAQFGGLSSPSTINGQSEETGMEPFNNVNAAAPTNDWSIPVLPCTDDDEEYDSCDLEVQEIMCLNYEREIESTISASFVQIGETPKPGRLRSKKYTYQGTILTVYSPVDFYITVLDWRSQKKRLERKLEKFYGKIMAETNQEFGRTNHELLEPGLIVACCDQRIWRRAEILTDCGSDGDNIDFQRRVYKVLFIDTGEEAQVTQNQIRYLSNDFLKYRKMAQKCCLYKCLKITWDSAAVSRFQEIVLPKSVIAVKILRKRAHVCEVSFEVNIRDNSGFGLRRVDVGQELVTFQRRERVAALYQPPADSENDQDSETQNHSQPIQESEERVLQQ